MLLVVDDNPYNREILAEQLTARGHQVLQVEGGAEALAALDEQTFEAVILDVMMPGVDGLTVLRRIRQRFSLTELPVVMATARDDRLDIIEALRQGANDYVTKPLDFAVVYARLQTQLALKHATDEIRELNAQLEAAQERIARLSASSSDALRDVGSWSRAIAEEIASVVGATSIGVWLLEGTALWSTGELPPTSVDFAETMERKLYVRGDDTLFAITSIGGDVYGALVVSGRTAWRVPERQLLDSFARQLGSALEVQRMRGELASAQTRLQLRRQEMLDRGIDILHVCPKCGRCYDHRRERCGSDGAMLECPRLLPLRIRGRYRFVRALSSGGMAKVFEAADEKLGRAVAVKIIKPEHFDNAEMRIRFEQEARAVARIDHPGVIGVYDSGELEEGSLFFIMELLRGLNLGQALQRHGRGTPRQVAALVRQMGGALSAAHRAGFIHRDIKPENIFLVDGPDGFRVKLLDFGIAKAIDGDSRLTQTGAFIGTPGYMAPEQLLGLAVDARTDLYSFGAVVYEALTGRRAAEALRTVKPELELLAAALQEEPAQRASDVDRWSLALAEELERMPAAVAGWPARLGDAPPPMTRGEAATLPG
jgi:CheY-like chemotaxis protein/tRNA A-37 threonylcarbamoyl transferase component Bud32